MEPAALLEPTCGLGNFLFAGLDQFKTVQKVFGADINPEYVAQAECALDSAPRRGRREVGPSEFLRHRLASGVEGISGSGSGPRESALGHHSRLGVLESQNVPIKSNFQKHSGLDAMTGKSNFDISEWMLMCLFESMNGRTGALAMLCKSSTARKTLTYAWKKDLRWNSRPFWHRRRSAL